MAGEALTRGVKVNKTVKSGKSRHHHKKMTVKETATKALQLAKKLNVREERKYFNDTYNSALATSFNTFNMLEIAQGDTATSRDGNSIWVQYIRCRLNLTANAQNQITGCLARVVIIQDLQQSPDNAPASGDIFLTNTDWNSVYHFPAEVGRFKVLYDETFDVTPDGLSYANAGGTASTVNTENFREIKIIPPRKKVNFNGPLDTDIQKNGIYMFLAKSNNSYIVTPDIDTQVCFLDN